MKPRNLAFEGTCLMVSWRDGMAVAKKVGEGESREGEGLAGEEGEGRKKKGHLARERLEGLRYR